MAHVDAWLQRAAKDSTPQVLLDWLQAGLDALCVRTNAALGEVTLSAIAARVVHNGAKRFALFTSLSVGPSGAIDCTQLRERLTAPGEAASPQALHEAIRRLLVEFLTVVGNLTAEVLTGELHAALSKAAPPATAARGEDRAS